MAMFYKPPPGTPGGGPPEFTTKDAGLPVDPPPPEMGSVDPAPWIEAVIPPEAQRRPPVSAPPVVVIEPVEIPPIILPPPPDIMPVTIVPWEYEDSIPEPLPVVPTGAHPPVRPPPTLVVAGAVGALGTFMVYVGRRLVLTMAASLGTSLGKSAGAMLVGAINKQLFRGTTIRFHTGQAFGLGDYGTGPDPARPTAASMEQAWRLLPQEFSYWEA